MKIRSWPAGSRGLARRDTDNLPLRSSGVGSTGGRFVCGIFQKRQHIVADEPLEGRVELAGGDGRPCEGGQRLPLTLARLAQRNLYALLVELDDVVAWRHRAANAHAGNCPGVHDPHPRDAPDIRDVAMPREDHVHPKISQYRHYIAGVVKDVHVAARTGDGEDVVVYQEHRRPPIPIPKFGGEPAVVLPPHLSVVQVRFGRVEHHDLRRALRHRYRNRPLAHPEYLLEVPVSNTPRVVVAHSHDHMFALQTVQILLRLLKLPPVALCSQIPDDGNKIGLHGVRLLDGRREEIGPEQARSYVNIRHLDYLHLTSPA